MQRELGRFSFGALLAGLLFLLGSTPLGRAHQQPPGCNGSGLGISLFTSSPDVHVGDTLTYGIYVFNGIPNSGRLVCDAEGIQAFIVTPDGVSHPITLVRTYLSQGQGDYYGDVVSYVVRAQDILPDGTVRATASDTGVIHQNDTDSQGGANQGVNTEVSIPCIGLTVQCVGGVGENGAITFTGTVTNCGNNTLVGVTVTNFVNGGQFHVTFITNLLRGQITTFNGSWVPLNPCSPSTATFVARANDELTTSPKTVTSSASTTCAEVLTPGIKVTKACPASPVSPGQLLTFTGSVSNTGNVTLTNVVVLNNQPNANTPVFTVATLAPGAVTNFTGSYTAPANCSVSDTLTATASSRCGVAVSDTASATCPIVTTPRIAVTATCPTGPVAPGSTVTFAATVSNTGDITLNSIAVTSDRPSPNTAVFSIASLAPGASANFTGTYTVPANSCSYSTAFSATGRDACTAAAVTNTFLSTCGIVPAPAIAVSLVCPAPSAATGGSITYSGTVSNPGNITLTNVFVVNNQPAANTPVIGPITLAPGGSQNFTTTFTAPSDSCSVNSTVAVRGNDICSGTAVSNTATTTCPLTTTPAIVIRQSCPATPASLGGTLTYSGSVSNAGNITLTNIMVTNDRTGATPVLTTATLAPGAVAVFTGSYTVPANSGCSVASTVTVNANNKCSGAIATASATSTCPVRGNGNIFVSLTCPANATVLGAVFTYTGVVVNNGNVTLTNVVVTRDTPSPGTVVFSVANIAPGASAPFSGSYTVASSDACSTVTAVTARANDQCSGSSLSNTASITCPLITTPRIVVTQVCPPNPSAPGSVIAYSGTVSNAGNVTLTNIVVNQSQPASGTVFTLGSLAPGATSNFTYNSTAPLDACTASSTLSATGSDRCSGNSVNNSVTTTCPLQTSPQIAVTKNCPTTPPMGGTTLTFTGTVTNTGNITLLNVMVVNNQPVPNTAVFGPVTLAPGAGASFSGSYTTPLNSCSITDTLTARGTDKCSNLSVSNTVTATCPLATAPRISVTLVCPTQISAGGSSMTLSGTVSNPGNVALNNVFVIINQPANNTSVIGPIILAPNASANFTASFTAPLNACSVNSIVTARGTDSCSQTVVSNTATANCPLLTAPLIGVIQNCPVNPTSPGGVLTYTGTVSNRGNITLTNVIVTSDHTGSTPVATVAVLAPGATASFTGSYTVPLTNGCSISSTVTATGRDQCSATLVTATSTATCPLLTSPAIKVTLACPATPTPLGGTLTYTGTVSNSGNITLTNIVVVNNRTGNTPIFTLAFLAPRAVANFTGSYPVPPNCCTVSSTVSASGQGCDGRVVSDTASSTCTVLTSPSIVVSKVCTGTPTAPGQLLRYSGIISNAGNISLTDVTLVNSHPTNNSPAFGPVTLAPGESIAYTASYIVPLDFCGTDTITARGTTCGRSVTNSVTSACLITNSPALSVTKNCPLSPPARGGTFTYTGTVKNIGNVTLLNVYVTSTQPVLNTPVIGPLTLAPGESQTFTASFTAPSDCCEVPTTLNARGQDKCSLTTVTARVSDVCPLFTTPRISVIKICPQQTAQVGQTFTYSGIVSNAGDINLTNVFVFSDQPNANTPLLGPIELAPGETEQFGGSYTVTVGSNPANGIVTAGGADTCQARSVTAAANCFGPISPLTITSVTLTNGVATVTWLATPGTVYNLQCKTNLLDSGWDSIPGNVTASGGTASKSDTVGSMSQRLYRVQIVQ